MQWEIWGLLYNLTHLRQIGGFLAAVFIFLKEHSEIMKLSISTLALSVLGNPVMSVRGGTTPYWDFPVQYQSTTQPEGSFPTIKPDPLPLFSREEGSQQLLALFPGYLVDVKDCLGETNASLRIFREGWVPRFTITQIIG